MYLVQLLLPIRDNGGATYSDESFRQVSEQLATKFGGVTAYSRAPAKGQWLNNDRLEKDDVIAVEVMVDTLDRQWWNSFRARLESEFRQTEIVIRAHLIERL